jgi:hypothetical protein
MELAHRWVDRNLTRIELVVATLILALLVGVFSQYMFTVFAKAERSMVNRIVININTALHYRSSMMVMKGQYEELKLLLKINPMKELQSDIEINDIKNNGDMFSYALSGSVVSTPLNYGGEIVSEYMNTMEKGKWYFLIDNNELLYKIKNNLYFSNDIKDIENIRFIIKLDYKDNNINGTYEQNIDEFKTVKLKALDLINEN